MAQLQTMQEETQGAKEGTEVAQAGLVWTFSPTSSFVEHPAALYMRATLVAVQ